MTRFVILCLPVSLLIILAGGCDRDATTGTSNAPAEGGEGNASFAEVRSGLKSRLIRREKDGEASPKPPANLFQLVRYDSPAGKLAAYVTPAPARAAKRPAIIWLSGGFSNGIGETAWEPATPDNDQSASAFRKAGIVMMYPSYRGGNDNPGVKEGFFGEVDDVLAAADFLARQPHVDPTRIYLGGHSTGGTLALLVAAAAPERKLRAVFSFGPVAGVADYGQANVPFDVSDERESAVRDAGGWIASVRTPVFVIEGTEGNIESLQQLSAAAGGNAAVRFLAVDGGDHFGILAPGTKLIASRILRDEGAATNIRITDQELEDMMRK